MSDANDRDPHGDRLREASGEVEIVQDRLTAFLYELMRDLVPPGRLEALVRNAEPDVVYTNGWLANYARDMAERLRAD